MQRGRPRAGIRAGAPNPQAPNAKPMGWPAHDELQPQPPDARRWIPLVNCPGGLHHGCFLPHEGPNDIAVALFSFPSLAACEAYRAKIREN